ncbi:MAG: hypothetical protein V1707_03330 [bacterium]
MFERPSGVMGFTGKTGGQKIEQRKTNVGKSTAGLKYEQDKFTESARKSLSLKETEETIADLKGQIRSMQAKNLPTESEERSLEYLENVLLPEKKTKQNMPEA